MEIINQIISLTKKSEREPFLLQFKFLDGIDVQSHYLPDNKIFLKGMQFNGKTLSNVDSNFNDILTKLFQSIENYPWTWDLNGIKLDSYGFDMYYQANQFRFSPTALTVIKGHIGYTPERTLSSIYSTPQFAYSPFLTKLSIELEKTSVLSEFSLQMHSVQPVRIAGFIYESSINGESQPIQLNLDALKIDKSNETIIITFGEPIVAKRITLTLAQDNLKDIIVLKNQSKEEKLETIKDLLKYNNKAGDIIG